MKEILVYADEQNNKNIFLVEEGKITENYEENFNKEKIEGDIYLGKVQKILPGMQAAFVDIGKSKNAFLHIKDIIPKVSNETGNKNENFEKININKYIRVGMPIMVQINKDTCGSKGAKATTHIKLSGRFIVLIPNVNFITVSTKIEDTEEKNRLKEIVKEIKEENVGIIIRTSAQGKSKLEIQEELNKIIAKWESIKKKANIIIQNKQSIPCILDKNYKILEKLVIDFMDKDLNKIIVNKENLKNNISDFIAENEKSNIVVEVKKDIFNMYDVQKQYDKLKERKVWLKCGGFITIDKTEALTAIDVNTGKYTGKDAKEDTVFVVNKEATMEIAKQIRLRDIGGIIIVDYIDMNEKNRNSILEIWNKCIKLDRSKVQIIGFTPLNLLEITRKHMWS